MTMAAKGSLAEGNLIGLDVNIKSDLLG